MENVSKKLYLVLGCFGRVDEKFVSCSSCENKILEVHHAIGDYNGMMDFFEIYRLFDRPCFDFNAIKSFLFHMQDKFLRGKSNRPIWSEKEVQLHQNFLLNHRFCGLYLKLIFDKDDKPQEIEEKKFQIKAISKLKSPITPKVNFTALRKR